MGAVPWKRRTHLAESRLSVYFRALLLSCNPCGCHLHVEYLKYTVYGLFGLSFIRSFMVTSEVSISLINPWPFSFRYYLNSEYRSRQIITDQIGSDDQSTSDWSTTK